MDRRKFLNTVSATAAASRAGATSFSAKADALEEAMEEALAPTRRAKPGFCTIGGNIWIRHCIALYYTGESQPIYGIPSL